MQVFTIQGTFIPSELQRQLLAAGIDVLGLTCIGDEEGGSVEVQVICEDSVTRSSVDAVVAAYTLPLPPVPIALDPPIPASVVKDIVVAAITSTVSVTSPGLTQQQKDTIKNNAEQQVQAVIDAHLEAQPA